jgi:DNA-cytosine methyltransferase
MKYKYYASEIDKYTIKVTQANFPNTIQLGDVKTINCDSLLEWFRKIKCKKLDILVGGSPCQGFSFAGKQLNFDDERSKLFFEFVRLKDTLKPKYFLLENVVMKQEYQDIISKYIGVKPIMINSSNFTAQNRKRLYWTNIPIDMDIQDKGIVLQDILEEDGIACSEMTSKEGKSHCLTATYNGAVWWNSIQRKQRTMVGCIEVGHAEEYAHYKHEQAKRVYHKDGKAPTLLTMQGGNRQPKVATYSTKGGRIVNRRLNKDGVRKDYQLDLPFTTQIEVRDDDKTNCLTTVQKDNIIVKDMTWRKLTPLECERLQGLSDNYTNHVSNSQRYKMLGNGFNIPTIKHIIKNLPLHDDMVVLSLFDGYSGFQKALHETIQERTSDTTKEWQQLHNNTMERI